MRIITYVLAGDELPPEDAAAVARILTPMVGKKGKLVEAWHPVVFTAPDADAARARAKAWWDSEIEKERKRQENYALAGKRLATARQGAAS